MKLGGTYCKPNYVNSGLEMCAHRGAGAMERGTLVSVRQKNYYE